MVCGKNSASRFIADPAPGASGKSIIRFSAWIWPVEWAYPVGVGIPSDICTPIVADIRHGPTPAASVLATGPALEWLNGGSVLLAEASAPMTRALAPASATGWRWLRIRRRGCCIEAPSGSAAVGRP